MKPSLTGHGESSFKDHVLLAVKILVLILLSPLLLLLSLPYLFYGLAIIVSVWLLWHPKGKYVLFVYSNSPNWQTHTESQILPKIADLAVVLNWSERKNWQRKWTLPVLAFYYFGGRRAFNSPGGAVPAVPLAQDFPLLSLLPEGQAREGGRFTEDGKNFLRSLKLFTTQTTSLRS